jgi:CubicO group peptidase (beta-lactamase class C family)
MKPMLCTSFLLASVTVFVFVARGNQVSPVPIPWSSSVFIDPMGGFGPELQAAFLNDGVPLVIVSNKDNADFEIVGEIRDDTEPTSGQPINGRTASEEQEAGVQTLPRRFVRVTIVDLRTRSVAWRYGAMRETFLYNNLMFSAVGHIIELKSGKTWEDFVRDRELTPLEMNATTYTIAEMLKHPDHAVPFREKRDSFELYKINYYEDTQGVAPAGGIISNIEDMSHWLIALMNDGKYDGKQVLPADVLKATMQPSIGLPNTMGEALGYWELLNDEYGMGRGIASYRGHLLTDHGGDLPGFHSQVSFMPNEKIGVIVFVIGDHAAPLYNVVSYNVFERLLGMDPTPWSDRLLKQRLAGKKAGTEARAKAGADRIPNTKPSHALADYVGEYENPAYGILKIGLQGDQLQFNFHEFQFPMSHFHYDRFDTPDDEQYGKFSVNFQTNPQGDIGTAEISLDQAEVAFTRKPEALDSKLLEKLAGVYLTPSKVKFDVTYQPVAGLSLVFPGGPPQKLILVKGLQFRTPQFADLIYEFVLENDKVTGLKERSPSGEYSFSRQ